MGSDMGMSIAIALIVVGGMAAALVLYNRDAMMRMQDERQRHHRLMREVSRNHRFPRGGDG